MATATVPLSGVTVPRSELARGLRAAASIKAKALHIDLTGDTVRAAAYTGDVAVSVTLDAALSDDGGSVFVPRELLAGVLAYCGHDIALSIAEDGSQVRVKSDDSTFEIRAVRTAPQPAASPRRRRSGNVPASVPPAPVDGTYGHDLAAAGGDPVTIEAPTLVETLRRTLPFASRDMTRPVLATVALYPQGHCAASTDSYRLAVVRYGDEGPKDEEPIKLQVEGAVSLQRLLAKKLGAVEIATTDTHHLVRFEDTLWSIRRVSGNYPSWRQLLPDGPFETSIKIDRDDLLTASRAASVVATRNAPLRLNANVKGATVTANGVDKATMTRRLPSADVLGGDVEIGLNPEFVADLCAMAPVERLTVKIIGPLRPLVVEAARDVYLLMPIRLSV